MEIKRPTPNMTKEQLYEYLWQLATILNMNFENIAKQIEEIKKDGQNK